MKALDRARAQIADVIYRAANTIGAMIGPDVDYDRCEICGRWLRLDEAQRGEVRWREPATFADSGARSRSWWPIHPHCRARLGLVDAMQEGVWR